MEVSAVFHDTLISVTQQPGNHLNAQGMNIRLAPLEHFSNGAKPDKIDHIELESR
jgi:hypothetical protein